MIIPKKYTATVRGKHYETPDVLVAELELPEALDFKPGQWVMVYDGKGNKRAYSIASPPSGKEISLCVKVVPNGVLSQHIAGLEKGNAIQLAGPYGIFTAEIPLKEDTIFVATGTGIAPFLSMLPVLFGAGTESEVWLIFGARTEKDLIERGVLEGLEKENRNFHYIPVLSRQAWNGHTGHAQDVMKQVIREPGGKQIYICGLPKMVEEVVKLAKEMGFKEDKIHIEKY